MEGKGEGKGGYSGDVYAWCTSRYVQNTLNKDSQIKYCWNLTNKIV